MIGASAVLLLSVFSTNSIAQQADLIFTGENIITMDASEALAVAVRGDRIVASGSLVDAGGQNLPLAVRLKSLRTCCEFLRRASLGSEETLRPLCSRHYGGQ